ncbi:MAG: hypothetical protein WBQ17_17640 [Rhizomicrobium sp.]
MRMTDRRDSEGELVAQIRGTIRAEGRMYWSVMIAFLIISVLFLGIQEFHLPLESTGIAALGVLLIWIALAFRIQTTVRPIAGSYDKEELLRKTIDDQHRRWRWMYTFVFIMVGSMAAMITCAVLFIASHQRAISGPPVTGRPALVPGATVSVLSVVVDFAFFAVLAAFQVCFGPRFLTRARRRALNDEVTRAMQRSAAMFGYLLCVISMCAVLAIMTIHPQWGLVTIPGTIAAAVILPGLYFLIRQWRAGRDG